MVTRTSVIKSGGVMIAAIIIITIKACRRYFEVISELTAPIFPRKKAITGS